MRTLALALVAALPALARAEDSQPAPAPAAAAAAQEWEEVPSPDAARATPPAPQPAQQAAPPEPAPAKGAVPVPPPYAPPPAQVAPPPPYAPPPASPPRVVSAPPAPPVPPLRQRGSWYIGFGLGSGNATFGFDDGASVDMKDMVPRGGAPFGFNFRVGGTLTPKLLLGFDGGFLASDGDEGSSVQLDTYGVGFMFFPQERGLYLRGVIGLSELEQDIPGRGSATASGWHATGGLGYALWLGKRFNLTLNLDAQHHSFDESNVKDATAWSGWLGFDWY